jgi:hypothetical protein
MESNRRRSSPEGSADWGQEMTRWLGNAATGVAPCPGFASWRAVCALSVLNAGVDVTISLEVSSDRLSDSGTSLQIRPKVNKKTKSRQNLPGNRISLLTTKRSTRSRGPQLARPSEQLPRTRLMATFLGFIFTSSPLYGRVTFHSTLSPTQSC